MKKQLVDKNGKPLAYSQHFTASQSSRTRKYIPAVAADSKHTLSEGTRKQIMGLARFLYNNSSICKAALDQISIYSIGNGLKPQSLAKPEAATAYEEHFNQWAKTCDSQGSLNLDQIQFLCSIAVDRDGDVGIALSKTPYGKPQVTVVESHRICSDYDDDGFADGIATDRWGRVKSYQVKADGNYRKFSPADFILIQDSRRVGQARGLSSLSSVINTLDTVDSLLRWEATACLIQSSIGMVITTPEGEANDGSSFIEDGFTAADTDSLALDSWGEGQIPRLAAGESIQPFAGAGGRPSATFNGFIEHLIHSLSLGLNIPYEFLWSPKGLNGAIQRFILKKAERSFNKRKSLIENKLMHRLWAWVIASGIKDKQLPPDDQWWKCRFIGDSYPSIDFGRDSQQTREDIKLGIKTLAEVSAENGKSWEDVRRQSYTEADNLLRLGKQLADEHGITLDAALNLLSTRNASGVPTVEEED